MIDVQHQFSYYRVTKIFYFLNGSKKSFIQFLLTNGDSIYLGGDNDGPKAYGVTVADENFISYHKFCDRSCDDHEGEEITKKEFENERERRINKNAISVKNFQIKSVNLDESQVKKTIV